jgi:hypothetical protein
MKKHTRPEIPEYPATPVAQPAMIDRKVLLQNKKENSSGPIPNPASANFCTSKFRELTNNQWICGCIPIYLGQKVQQVNIHVLRFPC